MRIALVLAASTGGIGRHVASLAPRLVARGHRVRIYCPAGTAAGHGLSGGGADWHPLHDLVRLRGADVLHAHGYKAGALACGTGAARRIPVVVTWHNAVLGASAGAVLGRALQRMVARGADLTLGASSDLVALAVRLGAPNARLGAVAAPVLPPPERPRDVVRADWGAGPEEVLVLTVGRLAPQKNLGLVVEAAAALRDDPRLRFMIAGDGPLRSELEARIAATGARAELIGHRADLPDLLVAADLALLTSRWEARALVAQEALLAGLPLISTRVGGIEELVGDAAVLVPPDDPGALIEAVRTLAGDPARRADLARRGRARAASWPDEDAVVSDLLAAYRSVWHGRPGGSDSCRSRKRS